MKLALENFTYELPDDRIAKHPPKNREDSRLLSYHKGEINHHEFSEITQLLPKDSLLVFNDTKVIPARLILNKETGARIEIFLLEPLKPSAVHEEVMQATKHCTWKCMIGNAKKWKVGTSLTLAEAGLVAHRLDSDTVAFEWETGLSFSHLLTEIGKIPLPPYLGREVEEDDATRYQTVYSRAEGAVAAPTAGLHFTKKILGDLGPEGIQTDYLTLHVSAGTFQPIKAEKVQDHNMHNEQIWISKKNIENLLNSKKTIAVGTTSMRTLESLYWYGVKLKHGENDFFIDKNDPYRLEKIQPTEALEFVHHHMKANQLEKLGGHTEIFIYPGYQFMLCEGLVTNFHMPGSTLILLIAAFIGNDWKKVYQEALLKQYRFLSYGDSSLLIP